MKKESTTDYLKRNMQAGALWFVIYKLLDNLAILIQRLVYTIGSVIFNIIRNAIVGKKVENVQHPVNPKRIASYTEEDWFKNLDAGTKLDINKLGEEILEDVRKLRKK